jgi:manganese transport protein
MKSVALATFFIGDRQLMGEFINPNWFKVLAYAVATVIFGLNGWLLILRMSGWLHLG